jgi:uncharacterized membrane protein YhaH (DUF805 family)
MQNDDFPPVPVTRLLRLDGFAVAAAAIVAYVVIGGTWWLFALLILAPDLALAGRGLGEARAANVYNWVHSYTLPLVLGAIGHFAGIEWMLPVALIWATHIGVDRALGYGLKYPHAIEHTHLGLIGRARKAVEGAASR